MTNKEKFIELCKTNISRQGVNNLITWLESTDFFVAPASSKYHGNYEGGLLEHSLNVFEQINTLYNTYKEQIELRGEEFSLETLTIVALLHDVCKINFYKKGTRNVKEGSMWVTKDVWEIDEKIPLGHGEKSCIILTWFMSLNVKELLAIRWHMGAYDSAFKGGDYSLSRAQEYTSLVTLLSMADMAATNLFEKTIK